MKYCTDNMIHGGHHGSYHHNYLVDVAITPVPECNKVDLVLGGKIHLGVDEANVTYRGKCFAMNSMPIR